MPSSLSTTLRAVALTAVTKFGKKFLDFYAQGHKILPSASLVPEDPTVLLTIAGCCHLNRSFRTTEFKRATTSQVCIRTNDIENVGRTTPSLRCSEISALGLFQRASDRVGWLSTQAGLPEQTLSSACLKTTKHLRSGEIGVPARIRMGRDDNWDWPHWPLWSLLRNLLRLPPRTGENIDLEDDTRFIEFYNLVFMQYNQDMKAT